MAIKKQSLIVLIFLLICKFVTISYYPLVTSYHNEINTTPNEELSIIEETKEELTECYIEPVLTEAELQAIERQKRLSMLNNEFARINKIMDAEKWFDEYVKITNKYSDILTQQNLSDSLNATDIEYLYRAVETETYQAPFDAKARVASVIFNRLKDGRFGDNVTEIVTNPNQFCYGRQNISESTKKACLYAYIVGDIVYGALYFDSFNFIRDPSNLLFTDNVGHNFYLKIENKN